jgi:DNA repair protein SbcC/Rad50
MIPVRLEMKNFLPYRSPDPVYFEGIHLACLTGNNGAGKSSLLDAITFALWGKARGKRDDDLVHTGQPEMYVQLDFEQEGTIYRVLRRRKGGKRSQGFLDLFTLQADNSLRTINEPSIDQTQKKIDSILRLTYDIFINSAFLQQGKADAFTSKTPADRKKMLSNILGLERWGAYEESAKAQLSAIDKTITGIEGALTEINEEMKREPEYVRERENAVQVSILADRTREDAEARLAEVQDAPANLEHAKSKKAQIEIILNRSQQDLKAIQDLIQERTNNIELYSSIIDDSETIEAGYRNLQEARQANTSLGTRLSEISNINERINQLQSQISHHRAELESRVSAERASIREIQERISTTAQNQHAELNAKIAHLEQIKAERDQLNQTVATLREERAGLAAQLKTLNEEGTSLNLRIEQLNRVQDAACPLCGQPLDEHHRDQIVTEITAERDHKRTNWTDATRRIKEIDTELEDLGRQDVVLENQIAPLNNMQGQLGALEKVIEQSEQASQKLQEAQVRLEQFQLQLDTEDYAHEWRKQLQEVQAEHDLIQYDASEHDRIKQHVTEYQAYESKYTRLELARQHLPREQAGLQAALDRQKLATDNIARDEEEFNQLSTEIINLTQLAAEYKLRFIEATKQRTLASQARERLAAAEQQIKSLENQRRRKADYEQRRAVNQTNKGIYDKLKLAFGKNGIPAMIIESAIPELESATNELLARMTDGKMHMRLVTQREKVSSAGTIETLDIEIADELGTRPYEMYSGGETFRIDFAIRVALSRMLARRAGAHLRTLFIDEGFGTQDDDGRNKLIEAINAIQQEFELILVITHIDELRDAFPVHIMVEKTASGSMIAIR